VQILDQPDQRPTVRNRVQALKPGGEELVALLSEPCARLHRGDHRGEGLLYDSSASLRHAEQP
jgi:hypothetical protein